MRRLKKRSRYDLNFTPETDPMKRSNSAGLSLRQSLAIDRLDPLARNHRPHVPQPWHLVGRGDDTHFQFPFCTLPEPEFHPTAGGVSRTDNVLRKINDG